MALSFTAGKDSFPKCVVKGKGQAYFNSNYFKFGLRDITHSFGPIMHSS